MHVVVGVALDSKKLVRGGCVPAMQFIDRFINTSGIFFPQKTVVFCVIDQLDEENAHQCIDKLEGTCSPSEHKLDRSKHT